MSSSRAGGGSGSAAIPANARKSVQSLKEIVPNSEDEIYAVLKECNMDPNETVQRLLNQDPFHEVKRKRDKKKEWNKEGTDSKVKSATGGTLSRGARGGMLERASGRGGSFQRHASTGDFNSGRGKPFIARENGSTSTSARVANTFGGPSLSTAALHGHGKNFSGLSNHSLPAATASLSPGLQNESPGYVKPAVVAQGLWGATASGHATMADIVKANGTLLPPPGLIPAISTNAVGPPVSTSVSQQYIVSGVTALPVSSGVYSSSTDPVLHPSLDPRAAGTSGAIKREIGTFGNQRIIGDWSSSSPTKDSLSALPITSQSLQTMQTSTSSPATIVSLERDTQVRRPNSPTVSVAPPVLREQPSHSIAETGSSVGGQARHGTGISLSGALGPRTAVGDGPLSSRSVYFSQQHPVGTLKVIGAGLEWKPKLVVQSSGSMGAVNTASPPEAAHPSSPPAVSGDSGILSATSKLHSVNIHYDQPVIIPNHLLVAEEEQTHLSFGSFAAGFGSSFSGSFISEVGNKAAISIAESTPVVEKPMERSSASSVANTMPVTLSQSYAHQSIAAPEGALAVSREIIAVSLPPTVLQSNLPKPDPMAHQGPPYSYLPAMPNYQGFNVMQQVPVAQFTYETSETQPPDVTRLPSLVPYADPTASYYTPLFRPGSDGDARYPPFVTSNASNKFNGDMGLVNLAGQNLPSQEGGNPVLSPVVATQTSQTGNCQTVPPLPQHPLPLHAYTGQPGGAPMGHHFANVFGYQYITPSFAYMHAHPPPYHHNYTTNSVYPQAPTVSSYPTAAGTTYPPGGATAVKYQLPQYKSGNVPGSTGAPGYSGYSSAPSGYAVNPSVTVGSTTGYDVEVQQYKDNNIYIPSQQEGSTVWIQTQLSRDMAVGGMQTSSYYNIPGQGQHGAYAHAQQPTHSHTHPGAYASLYHPSQSGQAPAAHQILQQPQALGGGGGPQAGGYQHSQRTQQTWTNNY